MAISENATKIANLFDPEVVGAMLDKKLTNAIKFAPLATVDTTLVGRPGDEITLPSFNYIGIATVTSEGSPITINKLTSSTVKAKIKKIGNGVEITDEAVLSGFGDPVGEAVNQLALSIADAIDADILAKLAYTRTGETDKTPIPMSASVTTTGKVTADDIANALIKFGEDIDGEKVILLNATDYATIRKATGWIPNTEIGANAVIRGSVGMIHGCNVVVTNRLANAGTAYIVKPGALALYLKRDTMVETDRDIINKTTVATVDKHYVAYLKDATKAIKLS